MADGFRDKIRCRVHRALKDGTLADLPYEVRVRHTGTLTHNWRQSMKYDRRVAQRAESRRLIREQLA
jgi:hypothetical protein